MGEAKGGWGGSGVVAVVILEFRIQLFLFLVYIDDLTVPYIDALTKLAYNDTNTR